MIHRTDKQTKTASTKAAHSNTAATISIGVTTCTNRRASYSGLHCSMRMAWLLQPLPLTIKLEHPIGQALVSCWGPGCQGVKKEIAAPYLHQWKKGALTLSFCGIGP